LAAVIPETTNYQSGLVDCYFWFRQGNEVSDFGHGHSYEILGLLRRCLRFAAVHPGTLIANIGHLEEVFVDTHIGHSLLKESLMGQGAARSDDHTVQPLLLDDLAHLLLRVLGAAEEVILHVDYAG